jgi:GT2 family glycosyltransferase
MEAASNSGIRACDSDFILIHDDDDSLEPRYLDRTVSFLEGPGNPSFGGVVSLTNQIVEREAEGGMVEVSRNLHRPLRHCIQLDEMARINQFAPIALLFRRSAYEIAGPFDESLPVLGDWDFHLRLLFAFDIGVVPERLANYHLRPAAGDGAAANSLYAGSDKHAKYDSLLRNRYARSEKYATLGLLMQLHGSGDGPRQRLQRLYRHPVIGGAIRAWSRFVNPSIPYNAD